MRAGIHRARRSFRGDRPPLGGWPGWSLGLLRLRRGMADQALCFVARAVGLKRGVRVMAGCAREPVLIRNEASALEKSRPLKARELGIAGLDGAVRGMAFHARIKLRGCASGRSE